MVRKSLAFMLVVAAAVAAAQPAGKVSDRYAFLIPQFGRKATRWAKEQTDVTRTRLENSPSFTAVLADMRAVQSPRASAAHVLPPGWPSLYAGSTRQVHPYGMIAVADTGATVFPRPGVPSSIWTRTTGRCPCLTPSSGLLRRRSVSRRPMAAACSRSTITAARITLTWKSTWEVARSSKTASISGRAANFVRGWTEDAVGRSDDARSARTCPPVPGATAALAAWNAALAGAGDLSRGP